MPHRTVEAAVPGTGIGPALREARQLRGKSIEEASRETRIRLEYLQALERERFESLLGDVYVRGFLRSYSDYLGLDPDRVLGVYNRTFGPPRPTLPEAPEGPRRSHRSVHPHMPNVLRGRHPSWTFLIVVAVSALAVLGAAGLLSNSRSAPRSQPPPANGASATVLPPKVVVALSATRDVRATVVADGRVVLDHALLRRGQGLSWDASGRIEVRLARGGLVKVVVNGHSLGTPGTPAAPYAESFGPLDYRRPSSTSSPGR
jgi:cytoskeleton protein RodZ